MEFKELCNSLCHSACVVSYRELENGESEIRIVDGNDPYIDSFKADFYSKHEFIPNSVYTDYLIKNLNFEEYVYRSAEKKELLHSYAYHDLFKIWMHMLFIPLEHKKDGLPCCLYIMEIKESLNPELLAPPSDNMYSKVLKTALQLENPVDFSAALKNVTQEIRKICNALFCCILLVDEENEKLTVLAEDREPNSDRLTMSEYMDASFFNLVKTWGDLVDSNGNCIIVKNEKEMEYIKENDPLWYESLMNNGIDSLVLFRLKAGDKRLGYMWVSNFRADDTPKIKEALEITTFILGSQIGNHLMLDQLKKLSSTDLLTGFYNRNELNRCMNELLEIPNEPIGLIFLDINGLKKVNDLEGHVAGDNLIKRAAKALKETFDLENIFRVGGDEFVIILRNVAESKIKEGIERLHQNAKENDVSFAAGYAMTNCSKDIEKILIEADFNMYNDKRKFYKK